MGKQAKIHLSLSLSLSLNYLLSSPGSDSAGVWRERQETGGDVAEAAGEAASSLAGQDTGGRSRCIHGQTSTLAQHSPQLPQLSVNEKNFEKNFKMLLLWT